MTDQRAKDPIKPVVIAIAINLGAFFTVLFFLKSLYWVWVITLPLSSYISAWAFKEEYVGYQSSFSALVFIVAGWQLGLMLILGAVLGCVVVAYSLIF